MASGGRVFRRSIATIAAQAAFSLLVLVAVTAPSLRSGTPGTRLQAAEGVRGSSGENAAPREIARTTGSSRPLISPLPEPQARASGFTASSKPAVPAKQKGDRSSALTDPQPQATDQKGASSEGSGKKGEIQKADPPIKPEGTSGEGNTGKQPEEVKSPEPAVQPRNDGTPARPKDGKNNNNTSTTTRKPSGAATNLAASSATLTVVLCAYMITTV